MGTLGVTDTIVAPSLAVDSSDLSTGPCRHPSPRDATHGSLDIAEDRAPVRRLMMLVITQKAELGARKNAAVSARLTDIACGSYIGFALGDKACNVSQLPRFDLGT